MEKVTLENSDETLTVHNKADCVGPHCTIHNRSIHGMRNFPQHWRSGAKAMERICPHGIGHPDPDDISVRLSVHGCDGCCRSEINLSDDGVKEVDGM